MIGRRRCTMHSHNLPPNHWTTLRNFLQKWHPQATFAGWFGLPWWWGRCGTDGADQRPTAISHLGPDHQYRSHRNTVLGHCGNANSRTDGRYQRRAVFGTVRDPHTNQGDDGTDVRSYGRNPGHIVVRTFEPAVGCDDRGPRRLAVCIE